jgi:phage terminase large subunit-like protein
LSGPTHWDLSCTDWEQRLRDGRSLVPDLPLDREAGDRAVAVFDRLQLPDVTGNPYLAEAAGDWFRDIVRAAFGSWDAASQQRYIREIFALVGKKNSKTTYSAAMGLTWLLLNRRPKAVGILVAPTQDIADAAFSQADGMVQINPNIKDKRVHVQNHLKKLTNLLTGATLEIFTFDSNVLTGQRPAFWLLDELHVIGKKAKAASAIGQLRGGMISIPESFGMIISTQSDEAPTGIFKSDLMAARAIRDGRIKASKTLPILYEFPDTIARDEVKWRDPRNWPMVMPNNGRSITVPRMQESLAEAETKGREEVVRWASQHLNIQIGVGLKTDNWPGAKHWEKNGDSSLTLGQILERSDLITVGVDGGGLYDMLGLAVLGRETYEELVPSESDPDVYIPKAKTRWLHWGRAWLHRDALEHQKDVAPKFLELAATGDLVIVERMDTAVEQVADEIEQIFETGLLRHIGFDPVGVKEIVEELGHRGIFSLEAGGPIEGVKQGYTLQGTIKSVANKLADGELIHCAQALMSWCVGNCMLKGSDNAHMVTKQASGTAKIDPVMAIFDAAHLMPREEDPKASVYTADRGLRIW